MIRMFSMFASEPDAHKRAAGGAARFIASTAAPARSDASIIDQATWKLDQYATNPVVMQDHDYEVENIVGRGEAKVDAGRLMLDVTWAPTPAGEQARALYEGGFLHAVSVGWIPGRIQARNTFPPGHPYHGERGIVYFDCTLLEVSMVAIGDDPTAIAETPHGSRATATRSLDVTDIARTLAADATFARALAAELQLAGALAPATDPVSGRTSDTPHAGGFSFFRKG